MSDDSKTVEDTKKGSLAEVSDDSCTLEFIEIVPLDVHSITKQHGLHVNTGIDLSICVYTNDAQLFDCRFHNPLDFSSGDFGGQISIPCSQASVHIAAVWSHEPIVQEHQLVGR